MSQDQPTAVFPTEKVKSLLSGWWDSKMHSRLKTPMKGPVKGTVFALQPEMSSQQAVGILVSCKTILGYRPSKDVIKKGGYANKAEFLDSLLKALEDKFAAKQAPQAIPAQMKGSETNAAVAV
jgi:hypothetical protein